jgi:hypothetical protein
MALVIAPLFKATTAHAGVDHGVQNSFPRLNRALDYDDLLVLNSVTLDRRREYGVLDKKRASHWSR